MKIALVCRESLGAVAGRSVWPVIAFLGICALQLVPLPSAVVEAVSPRTVAMRWELLGDVPGAPERLRFVTLSLYPHATRHDLRLVLLASVAFLATVTAARTTARVRGLLIATAILGAALATLSVAQHVTKASGIYWQPTVPGEWWAGTFINHTDFAQHMSLAVGAALALGVAGRPDRSRPEGASGWRRASRWTFTAAAWAVAIVGVTAIFLARSRGGIIAVGAGGFLFVVALAIRSGARRAVVAAALLLALLPAALWAAGGTEAVRDRMNTLQNSAEFADRLTTVRDLVGVWREFPLLGTGLGTHETFYPRYDQAGTIGLVTHAENEYAQVGAECGAIGLLSVLVFVAIVWRHWLRCLSPTAPPLCAAAVGLGYGLAAAHVQSLSSFGQHLPAVGCLSAVVCGLLVNLGRMARTPATGPGADVVPAGSTRRRHHGFRALATSVAMAAAAAWAVVGAERAYRAAGPAVEARHTSDLLDGQNWVGSPAEYEDLVTAARAAVEIEPDNVHYRYALAAGRWHAVDQSESQGGGDETARAAGLRTEVESVIADLDRARFDCPTYGPLYTLSGQLELLALKRPAGAERLRKAAQLAPKDETPCLAVGTMDARAGRWAEAAHNLRQVILFGRGQRDRILDLYIAELNRPDLAADLAPSDPDWLLAVASRLRPDDSASAAAVRHRAIEVFERRTAIRFPRYDHVARLGGLYVEDGRFADGAAAYRRAADGIPEIVGWRLAAAEAWEKAGRTDEARADAERCLARDANSAGARALLERLRTAARDPK